MSWFVGEVEAVTVTALPAAATQIAGEGASWLYWGVIIAIVVGLATIVFSNRIQSEFVQIFGHIIHKLGAGAFGAAAVALVALVGLAPGATLVPVSSASPWLPQALDALGRLVSGGLYMLPLVLIPLRVYRDLRRGR